MPSRRVPDLVDYYYNVLKLRASAAAVQWYQDKEQARMGGWRAQGAQDALPCARRCSAFTVPLFFRAHHLSERFCASSALSAWPYMGLTLHGLGAPSPSGPLHPCCTHSTLH